MFIASNTLITFIMFQHTGYRRIFYLYIEFWFLGRMMDIEVVSYDCYYHGREELLFELVD
jgi:hypothetical protein